MNISDVCVSHWQNQRMDDGLTRSSNQMACTGKHFVVKKESLAHCQLVSEGISCGAILSLV